MKIEIKSILVEKMDDAGHGLARLATLAAVDHDGDTYAPGAFTWKDAGGQWVPMLPAHDRGAMPFGKARVYEDGGVAFAELHLNLETAAGKDWQSHLKFDLATGKPAQEWSYGFGTVEATYEQRGEDRIRVLKQVDVHEVSPVIRGAGFGTATLMMKGQGTFAEQIEATTAAIDDIIERAGDIAKLRSADGRSEFSKARLDQLAGLKARLDKLIGSAAEPDFDQVAEALAADFLTRNARRRAGR